MAKEDDDNSKEGVDFEWVQGNDDENSGFKTRRFFTRAEKKARASAPTTSPMPKARPKKEVSASDLAPKTSPIPKARPKKDPVKVTASASAPKPAATTPAKVSVKRSPKLDNSLGGRLGRALGTFVGRQLSGPSKMDKMKAEATDQTNRSKANQGMKELMTGRKGAAAQYKSGGLVTKSGSSELKDKLVSDKKALGLKSGGMVMQKGRASRPCRTF